MIASSLLVGCNTFMEAQNASTKGAANLYSCEQINSAFAAYEADRASFEAYKQIAVMSGLDLSKIWISSKKLFIILWPKRLISQ